MGKKRCRRCRKKRKVSKLNIGGTIQSWCKTCMYNTQLDEMLGSKSSKKKKKTKRKKKNKCSVASDYPHPSILSPSTGTTLPRSTLDIQFDVSVSVSVSVNSHTHDCEHPSNRKVDDGHSASPIDPLRDISVRGNVNTSTSDCLVLRL